MIHERPNHYLNFESKENQVNEMFKDILFSSAIEMDPRISLCQILATPAGKSLIYLLDHGEDAFYEMNLSEYLKSDYIEYITNALSEMNLSEALEQFLNVKNDLIQKKYHSVINVIFISENLIKKLLNEKLINKKDPLKEIISILSSINNEDDEISNFKHELKQLFNLRDSFIKKLQNNEVPIGRLESAEKILNLQIGVMDAKLGEFFYSWYLNIIKMRVLRGEISHGIRFRLEKNEIVIIISVFIRTLQILGIFGLHKRKFIVEEFKH